MDESPEAAQNDDPSTTSAALPEVMPIAPKGDILLDVTFETSKSTLKATRKAIPKPRPSQRDPPPPQPVLKPQIRLAFRVHLATLKQHSRYFTNLLGDTRFQEASIVASKLEALKVAGKQPGEVEAGKLPRVSITDDDEATRSAGREAVFGDMLRMLHGLDTVTKPVNMLYVVTLAVMADRFACAGAVSRYLTTRLKFKWPATAQPRLREDGFSGLSLAAEELVRQKVLASWLLEWPIRFGAATRDLILFGSHRWSVQYAEGEDDEDQRPEAGKSAAEARQEAVWWYLPDELEEELHARRTHLLAALSSIPAHFLELYTHRTRNGLRQCKLGYDSSSACDSFQLGEMVKFLVSKNLLSLTTFSSSYQDERDFAAVDLHSILAAMKQCPIYQVDRNHTNCGLRTRIGPVIEYVTGMLSAGSVQLNLVSWKQERRKSSWVQQDSFPAPVEKHEQQGKRADFVVSNTNNNYNNDQQQQQQQQQHRPQPKGRVFRFTRAVATDQRLRFEGAMAADKMARDLFTADAWDWTPEDIDTVDRDLESRHLSMPLRRK